MNPHSIFLLGEIIPSEDYESDNPFHLSPHENPDGEYLRIDETYHAIMDSSDDSCVDGVAERYLEIWEREEAGRLVVPIAEVSDDATIWSHYDDLPRH